MVKEQTYTDPVINILRVVLGVFVGIFLLITLFQAFYTVPAGYRGVVLTFGSPSMASAGEGLHFKIPYAQSVALMSVQTRKYEADAAAASKDLQIVSANIATNFKLEASMVPAIYRDLGLAFEPNIIAPAEQETVKAVTAKFTAEELITRREEVRLEMKELLKQKLAFRGIIVEEVSITNFDFSQSFNEAIEAKVTAEQLKLKAERDLERIKVEAEQVEAQAIGQKNAVIAEAEGRAAAIRIIQQQLDSSPNYIEYLKVEKWNGKLPVVTGNAVPLISGLSMNQETP
ncbi:MAG: prohibitin family protein [Nanoarchaeota archaeon]|nr:prohibitin family protein [Nanoarchaeota archaeon]